LVIDVRKLQYVTTHQLSYNSSHAEQGRITGKKLQTIANGWNNWLIKTKFIQFHIYGWAFHKSTPPPASPKSQKARFRGGVFLVILRVRQINRQYMPHQAKEDGWVSHMPLYPTYQERKIAATNLYRVQIRINVTEIRILWLKMIVGFRIYRSTQLTKKGRLPRPARTAPI
jgi:hypothetical protein